MKTCPQCNEPNPDKLNFCGYCGANLKEDGELDEVAKLHNELAEIKELNLLYKQQKEDAEKVKKDLQKVNEDLLLAYNTLKQNETKQPLPDETQNKKIVEQDKQIKTLTQKLTVAEKEKTYKSVFILLFVMAVICAIAFFGKMNQYQDVYLSIYNENHSLQVKFDEVQNYYPLIIKSLKIGNADRNGTIQTDYGNTIYSSSTMYLIPQIEYVGVKTNQKITLYQKLFYNGILSKVTDSPNGYTKKDDLYVSDSGTAKLSGWGNETKGYWSSGDYRYEIWYNNMCLKAVDFKVY